MSLIRFWYPVPCFDNQFEGAEKSIRKDGTIRVINLKKEPYEVQINANGYGFHAIFGSQANGHFLCIPDWGMGCELGSYDDRFWNIESIIHTGRIGCDEAYAIGNALDLLRIMISR